MGKTFTVDPISKRRLQNFGEEDQFYIRNHHEAIISQEVFDKAQEILARRSIVSCHRDGRKHEKFSRQYAFSCMLKCGFCGGSLCRRSWHGGTPNKKTVWQCQTATRKGQKNCPESKGIPEEILESAFLESIRILCCKNEEVIEEMLKRMEAFITEESAQKHLDSLIKEFKLVSNKRTKLIDLRLEESIDKKTYEIKYTEMTVKIEKLDREIRKLEDQATVDSDKMKRIEMFRSNLLANKELSVFDRHAFESNIEKAIIGGYDEDGKADPYLITFIYKAGLKSKIDGTQVMTQKPKYGTNLRQRSVSSFSSDDRQNQSCKAGKHKPRHEDVDTIGNRKCPGSRRFSDDKKRNDRTLRTELRDLQKGASRR